MRPRGTERRDILATLPPELRLEASPERCVCVHCEPQLTAEERQADVDRQEAWRAARRQWRRANGVAAIEMAFAERDLRAEPRARSSKTAGKSSGGTKTKGSSTDV